MAQSQSFAPRGASRRQRAGRSPALAADVTPERLLNPDKEPQNWLMNHRTL